MAPWKALDAATTRRLLTAMSRLEWDWSVAAVPDLVTALGWRIVESVTGAGAVVDPGFGIDGKEVTFGFEADKVSDISVCVTETLTPQTPQSRAFIQDVFSEVAAAGVAVLGEPTRRVFSTRPEIWWRNDTHTITIGNVGVAVTITWETNEHKDRWAGPEEGEAW